MNFEAILNYFTQHVEAIIQWLFLGILGLSGFLISRGLLNKKPEGRDASVGASGGEDIKGVLDQILSQTAKLQSVSVQELSPEAQELAATQVEALKKELATREEEIKALKAAPASSPAMSEETDKLSARVKELEAKLAEYEILEDDIADLSLFKEENQRLRKEVEALRGGGAAPAAAAAAAPMAAEVDLAAAMGSAPEPADASAAASASTDDIVNEFAEAVNQKVASEEAPGMEVPNTGNPMSDFEAAVNAEREMASDKIPAMPAPAQAKAQPPAQPADAKESEDLFAEFAEAPKTVAEGDLDTDKMMAEMAALVSLEPATGNALEESVDTEKMVSEAVSLPKR